MPAARSTLAQALSALPVTAARAIGGAAVLAAAGRIQEARAVATIGAPFDVDNVTRLFAGGLDELREQGEADVRIGGRPLKLRQSFVDDLDIDSLSMVEIAVQTEDRYGVEIPDEDLAKLRTVQDAVDYIQKLDQS